MQLNRHEISTARIALIAWAARCEAEAKCMRELAKDFPDSKAAANAVASDEFRAEAEALLAKLRKA